MFTGGGPLKPLGKVKGVARRFDVIINEILLYLAFIGRILLIRINDLSLRILNVLSFDWSAMPKQAIKLCETSTQNHSIYDHIKESIGRFFLTDKGSVDWFSQWHMLVLSLHKYA